jgi:hypothetical protein
MKTWTPDASEHFESWLGRVRLSVAGDPSLNADDITQDLRAHVHAELEAAPEPVTRGALERVLDSLGNPTQWNDTLPHPDESTNAWFQRRVTDVVTVWQQKLAGDWGSPILLAVLTVVAIPTFDTIGVPLLLFAYFAARSQVVYAPQQVVGRKRWLVYLPLAIGTGVFAGLVLAFPIMFDGPQGGNPFELVWALGGWWVVVGLLAAREPRRVRAALRPFADGFDATHGHLLSLIGAALFIASSVVLIAR